MLTSRRKAHLIILTTFVLGVVVGAAGQYLLFHQAVPRSSKSVAEAADELAKVVRLDQSQRSQVEQILSETRQQYQEVKNQTRPQYLAVRDNARKRIRTLLSPEQQTLYDQWTKESDAKNSSGGGKHADK